MKKMQASTFRAHCYAIIKEVQATGESVIVTKRGKPIVKIFPVESEKSNLFEVMAGKCKIIGDIESSVWFQKF